MSNRTSRKRISQWLAPAAVALGLLCIVAGFGLLTWEPTATPLARMEATPFAGLARTSARPSATDPTLGTQSSVLPPIAWPTPTATDAPLSTVALMITSAPTGALAYTATPLPTATQAVSLAETGATFTLTIVHSNDTWGYTLPCG